MKNWAIILLVAIASISCQDKKTDEKETQEILTVEKANDIDANVVTTFYLMRHAEKELEPVKKDNPALTEAGIKRAQSWASYFSSDVINAIYTTGYDRTQHTIFYLAKDKDISAEIYYANELYNSKLLQKVQGQNIVVVGHSNTIPKMVNKMIGEEKFSDIDDDDYNNLYIVTFKGNTATAVLKEIN